MAARPGRGEDRLGGGLDGCDGPRGPGGPGGRGPAVLHLFAYTGLATLALVAAGASVVHVDASRPAVGWARRNAERSVPADRPIRWIVDDAVAFTEREVRRGRRYAGIVLDPPSYGHGPGSGAWRIEDDLPALLAATGGLLGQVASSSSPLIRQASRRIASPTRSVAPCAVRHTRSTRGPLELSTADGRTLALGGVRTVLWRGHDGSDAAPTHRS